MLVSKGAEEFDPDSMLDEDELPQPQQNQAHAISFHRPIVALTVINSFSEEDLKIAGHLRSMVSKPNHLSLTFECLFEYALKLAELVQGSCAPELSQCLFSGPKMEGVEEFPLACRNISQVKILEVAGTKSLVELECSAPTT